MRLFVAINLSDEIKDALCAVEKELQAQGARGNFSKRENLHLTLAFLGEVEQSRVKAVREAMAAAEFAPFTVEVASAGRFKRDEGDILWIGLGASRELTALQVSLVRELKARGFSPDDKPFNPHLTIGRKITGAGRIPESANGLSQRVESIELMLSERINGKLTYTPIYSRKA
ncbi:MAG: RNA 2',3'-cyclic phosphodiesterase [Oscillospiraceae bacterium]|nr:RNA 2',3'-cyclic phosphodiesterase [Oscillospiraceae bacterium]